MWKRIPIYREDSCVSSIMISWVWPASMGEIIKGCDLTKPSAPALTVIEVRISMKPPGAEPVPATLPEATFSGRSAYSMFRAQPSSHKREIDFHVSLK
jgi:hypothetical protein